MNGPKLSNLNKHTPRMYRFWANVVLILATTLGTVMAVSEHPTWGAVVTAVAGVARLAVEFFTDENQQEI